MIDLCAEMARASRHVRDDWDRSRVELALAAMRLRQRRQRLYSRLVAGFGVVALLIGGGVISRRRPGAGDPARVTPPWTKSIPYADGSRASAVGRDSELIVTEDTLTQVTTELRRGRASFDVVHSERRLFRVVAGPITVVVLGTGFSVERVNGGAWVSVERGRVRVEWPGGVATLGVGQQQLFLAPGPAPDQRPGGLPAVMPTGAAPSPLALATPARAGAEPRFEQGVDFPRPITRSSKAVAAAPPMVRHELPVVPPTSPPTEPSPSLVTAPRSPTSVPPAAPGDHTDTVESLLERADEAHSVGHQEEALALFQRIVREHPSDVHAPLAAFTAGRLLLGALGRSREAAQMFAEARRLAPQGVLAPDALAREAESWRSAGNAEAAKACALEYLRAYPTGRHVAGVSRYLGEQ
jgi:transmembrane sensor